MKIIIEKEDIEKFLNEKYPNATIISGLDKDIQILLNMPDKTQPVVVKREEPQRVVSDNPLVMKTTRGILPKF